MTSLKITHMQNTQIKEEVKKAFINKMQVMKEKQSKGEAILPEDRIHVAVLADSPTVVTGFGNVCREILLQMHHTGYYDFEIVGINYDGSPHDLPFKIHPAMNALIMDPAYREPYGRQKFLDLVGEGRFDIVWVLQDTFIVCEELGQRIQETNEVLPVGQQFAFMYYFPIDATPKKRWIDSSAMFADMPVVYTNYGHNEVMKLYAVDENSLLKDEEKQKNIADGEALEKKLNTVYHGINTEDFYPIEDAEKVEALREQLWGKHKDKFVFINVNRNQPRKDLFRSLKAFKILLERRRAKGKDDVYMYLHCNVFDNNINLVDISKQLNLVEGDEWAFPDPKRFGPSSGFPTHVVNNIYNASDAVISTTLGEGWGLSLTEAMATGKLIIAPDNTSIPEILGKTDGGAERGLIVKCNSEFVQQNDNGRVRPVTSAEDLADKMEWAVENKAKLGALTGPALEWVKELQWGGQKIGGAWLQLFENAYEIALVKRALEVDKEITKKCLRDNIGRNDECPACPGTKFKNCRHGQMADLVKIPPQVPTK